MESNSHNLNIHRLKGKKKARRKKLKKEREMEITLEIIKMNSQEMNAFA